MATYPADEPDAMEDVAGQRAHSSPVMKLKVLYQSLFVTVIKFKDESKNANNKKWSKLNKK